MFTMTSSSREVDEILINAVVFGRAQFSEHGWWQYLYRYEGNAVPVFGIV